MKETADVLVLLIIALTVICALTARIVKTIALVPALGLGKLLVLFGVRLRAWIPVVFVNNQRVVLVVRDGLVIQLVLIAILKGYAIPTVITLATLFAEPLVITMIVAIGVLPLVRHPAVTVFVVAQVHLVVVVAVAHRGNHVVMVSVVPQVSAVKTIVVRHHNA